MKRLDGARHQSDLRHARRERTGAQEELVKAGINFKLAHSNSDEGSSHFTWNCMCKAFAQSESALEHIVAARGHLSASPFP